MSSWRTISNEQQRTEKDKNLLILLIAWSQWMGSTLPQRERHKYPSIILPLCIMSKLWWRWMRIDTHGQQSDSLYQSCLCFSPSINRVRERGERERERDRQTDREVVMTTPWHPGSLGLHWCPHWPLCPPCSSCSSCVCASGGCLPPRCHVSFCCCCWWAGKEDVVKGQSRKWWERFDKG